MFKRIDITNKKFGKLTIIKMLWNYKKRNTYVETLCECGNKKVIAVKHIRSGATRSCGCFLSESSKKRFTTHGLRKTKIYNIWNAMKQRCNNTNNSSYSTYGGRGINISETWVKFYEFFLDMNGSYKEGLTLDRIDNNGNYCKKNCRWVTRQQQANNTSANVIFGGKTIAQIAREKKIGYWKCWYRLHHNIPLD